MVSDVEGIDEINETATEVQLVFHVRRDWLGDADEAVAEARRKADMARNYLLSPAFKQRFGMKPGTLLMKASRQPPADIMSEMARLGADVMVGGIPMIGSDIVAGASCAVCGRPGFMSNQMSMTERGLTCPNCFSAWQMHQDRRAMSGYGYGGYGRGGGMSSWQVARIVIGITVVIIAAALRAC
jgi:hypothetical protein